LSGVLLTPQLVDANLPSTFDASGFNFLAQQNGGNFDPILFGDYRETQDNVLSQDFGSFFNDAYPLPDLGSPSHNYGDVTGQTTDQSKKSDLMAKVDAVQASDISKQSETPKLMTCNKIWYVSLVATDVINTEANLCPGIDFNLWRSSETVKLT